MKKKKLVYLWMAALPFALWSCSSEDAALDGGGAAPSVAQGTVTFANGTGMTIGSSAATVVQGTTLPGSRVFGAAFGNETCGMEMEAAPGFPQNAVDLTNQPQGFTHWNLSVDTYVPAGKVYNLNGANLGKDIFVKGTLNINGYGPGSGTARIIVLDGGKVNFNMETLYNLAVLCYGNGEFNVGSKFNVSGNSRLMISGDFKAPGTMNISGCKMFVGGNFTCGKFDANGGSRIHVLGNAYSVETDITNSAMMCVDGTMKSEKLNLDSRGDLCSHDCKISTALLTMHNNTKLSAEYVKALKTVLTGCTVVLRNGGLADLGDLTVGSVQNMRFCVADNYGKAMVATTDCFLMEQYSLANVIGPDFYFNYDHFFVINQGKEEVQCPGTTNDGFHKVEIGTELVNVAVPGNYDEAGCNPGFKSSEEPVEEPEDKPVIIDSDDIVLDIPTDIQDDWFLAADDFAIRVDGAYQTDFVVNGNEAELKGIKITEDNLRVTVSGTDKLEAGREYTYEVWLWVRKDSWDAFTDAQKAMWLEGDGNGTDITDKCVLAVPEGFTVRRNVYTGLSGHADTPYIKVSLHIVKNPE